MGCARRLKAATTAAERLSVTRGIRRWEVAGGAAASHCGCRWGGGVRDGR
ncbi:large S protein [Sesbania bispinosa]|nr:large S protein [Sesbania bispinosa]